MFLNDIEERKNLVLGKMENRKKKLYFEGDSKHDEKRRIINKVINNEKLTFEEYDKFLTYLEYTFKKRLKEIMADSNKLNEFLSKNPNELKTKIDKSIYLILNIKK